MTDAASPLATMTDRRSLMGPQRDIYLFEDRLEAWSGGKLERRLGLETVSLVRMSVEMAGSQAQVACRVTGPGGEIAFGSRRAAAGGFEDNALAFRAVLVALHKQLLDRQDSIQFVEGQQLSSRLVLSGFGLVMAACALAFIGHFLLIAESALLSAAGFPFLVIGGYLAWVFRPARPIPYDPAGLVERFEGGAGAGAT